MKYKIVSLFIRLAKIQLQIESEQSRKYPDWMRLFRLKRLRLMIKDRMQELRVPQIHKMPKVKKQAVLVFEPARSHRSYVPAMVRIKSDPRSR